MSSPNLTTKYSSKDLTSVTLSLLTNSFRIGSSDWLVISNINWQTFYEFYEFWSKAKMSVFFKNVWLNVRTRARAWKILGKCYCDDQTRLKASTFLWMLIYSKLISIFTSNFQLVNMSPVTTPTFKRNRLDPTWRNAKASRSLRTSGSKRYRKNAYISRRKHSQNGWIRS